MQGLSKIQKITQRLFFTHAPNKLYVDNHASLNELPPKKKHNKNFHKHTVTIGDVHGNALKLLNFLGREDILKINRINYNKIKKIYSKNVNKLTAADLNTFNEILNQIEIKPHGMIRFLGDLLSDRGKNDYFTLKILERITPHIPIEIVLSNHDLEFLIVREKNYANFEAGLDYGQFESLRKLGILVKKGLVSRKEIEKMVSTSYLPHLKLISYSLTKNDITIYTHARIGYATLKSFAEKFNIPFNDKTPIKLAETIDKMNAKLNDLIKRKKLAKTANFKDFLGDDELLFQAPLDNPFVRIVWTRGNSKSDPLIKSINHFNIFWAHGHDAEGFVAPEFRDCEINLDNIWGKYGNARGQYSVLVSK